MGTIRKNGHGGLGQPISLVRIALLFIETEGKFLKQNFAFSEMMKEIVRRSGSSGKFGVVASNTIVEQEML